MSDDTGRDDNRDDFHGDGFDGAGFGGDGSNDADPNSADPNGADPNSADSGNAMSGANPDDLSDADVDAAFANFEQEFADLDDPTIAQMNAALERNEEESREESQEESQRDSEAGSADVADLGATGGTSIDSPDSDGFTDDFDADIADVTDMESELAQMLGEKANCAMLLTQVRDADVLAAFAAIAGIDAYCIADRNGAIAVLKDLDGHHPEDAAQALTKLVNGMSVILLVDRANHIEAHQWVNASQGESFPPPIVFMNAPAFVEDVIVGEASIDDILHDGNRTVIDTAKVSKAKAFGVLQDLADRANRRHHRRFGFGLRRKFREDDTGSDTGNGIDDANGEPGTDSTGDSVDGGTDPNNPR